MSVGMDVFVLVVDADSDPTQLGLFAIHAGGTVPPMGSLTINRMNSAKEGAFRMISRMIRWMLQNDA